MTTDKRTKKADRKASTAKTSTPKSRTWATPACVNAYVHSPSPRERYAMCATATAPGAIVVSRVRPWDRSVTGGASWPSTLNWKPS